MRRPDQVAVAAGTIEPAKAPGPAAARCLRRVVLTTLLLATGARADPGSVRPLPNEFLLDSGYVAKVVARPQFRPAVAANGAGYMVVWEDGREYPGRCDIYCARVDSQGTILDPGNIRLTNDVNGDHFPAIVWADSFYLLVWQFANRTIVGLRLGATGIPLDTAPFPILNADYVNYGEPAVAWNGTRFLVAVGVDWWSQSPMRHWWWMVVATVEPNGEVGRENLVYAPGPEQPQSEPGLVSDGTNWLLTWTRDDGVSREIYAARIGPDGTVIDTNGFRITRRPASCQHSAVEFDGTNFLAVWDDSFPSAAHVYGMRVTRAGTLLDPVGWMLSPAAGAQVRPAVASDGSDYLVGWSSRPDTFGPADIEGARIRPDGSRPDSTPLVIAGHESRDSALQPALTFGAGRWLAAWTDSRAEGSNIYAARVAPDRRVLDTAGIPLSPDYWNYVYRHGLPGAATGGNSYLVVWPDFRDDRNHADLRGLRISARGEILDTARIAVTPRPTDPESVIVCAGDSIWLVVWAERAGVAETAAIRACRVTGSGRVLDSAGITIAPGRALHPAAAFDGEHFVVAWEDGRRGLQVYAARVGLDGSVLDSGGVRLSRSTGPEFSPGLAFDGTNYQLVWEGRGTDTFAIFSTRVSPALAVLDSPARRLSPIAGERRAPHVAANREGGLVVWQDLRSGNWEIYGCRVSPDGTVPDTAAFPVAAGLNWSREAPRANCDGRDYSVAWQAWSRGSFDIYGCRVTADGIALPQFVVSARDSDQVAPIVLSGPEGGCGYFYSCYMRAIGQIGAHVRRTWCRLLLPEGIADQTPIPHTSRLAVLPGPGDRDATVLFALARPGKVSLKLLAVTGRTQVHLAQGWFAAGSYRIVINGSSVPGLPRGVYLVRLETDSGSETRKLVLR